MLYESIIGSSESIDSLPTIRMNFSINASPIEVTDVPSTKNFSENPVESLNDYISQCFSLLERIKISKKSPKQVLKARLKEVIRYCKSNDVATIKANKKIIIKYLSEYVYQIIMDCIANPNVSKVNLTMILGLADILENMKTVQKLQDFLVKAKAELSSSGALSKATQTELGKTYVKFWTELLYSIEEKYFDDDKKGVLVTKKKGLSKK